ncbi:hypothetical protein ACFQV2_31000 [Actinokineospora soli]|uniref:SPW repeat-containing protein n=1 Tax=Actinokineospora soli TaxID=1048753 RepID=A0ABW2TWM1_9PSEU
MDRPLSVTAWLVAPLVFAASVLGITAVGGLLVAAPWPVALSSALGGAATAIAAVMADAVAWRSRRQRVLLAVPYPVALLVAGFALDGVALPTWPVLAAGVAGVAALVRLLWRRAREV